MFVPDVKMPQLGESVTEGTIGQWLKAVGDPVQKYEPLVEVVTDKVTAEVPSDFEGTLMEICVAQDETVSVGTVLCRVGNANTDVQTPGTAVSGHEGAKRGEEGSGNRTRSEPSDGVLDQNYEPANTAPTADAAVLAGGGRFSPAVLTLSQQHQVDLKEVTGSGEGGRITRKDVLAFIDRRSSAPTANTTAGAPPQANAASAENPARATTGQPPRAGAASMPVSSDIEVVEASAVRKTIARRMVESKHNAPHAWTMVEVDVTGLQQFRDGVKADFKGREGIDLTYLPFFIKATVEGLKRYPIVNSSWVDGQIHIKKRTHISIAVATDDGLVVPVIHDADALSIAGIAHKVNELATKARSHRLLVADVEGGTFTVNNTGAFGSVLSQPILNSPQAAILSCEAVVKRPVVVNDAIAIRSMVNLCLSLDHRVLDGWVAGQFLQVVRDRLSSFGSQTVLY